MNLMRYTALLAAFFWVAASSVFAQKPAELKKSGERYFDNQRWREAMLAFSHYQQEKPGDAAVLTKLGICHYHLHDAEKARQYLEYVLNKEPNTREPDLFYYLARTLHGQREFQRAIIFYKLFLKNASGRHPLRAGVVDDIKRCVRAMTLRPNENVALVENLGDRVNTTGDEFGPIPSVNHADRLYFSSAREGCIGGLRTDEGLEDGLAGRWRSDMFFAELGSSGWELGDALSSLLNTARDEAALAFSEDGRVLYYFRGFTLFSGEMFADTAGRKDEYAVQPPTFDCPFRAEDGDQSPFFFNDSTLLFASRRPGGLGGLDIYISQRTGGQWSTPANLGAPVNSAYDETTPFLAHDGRTLYFSANHAATMGGLDVFKAVFDDKKRAWSQPENMGTEVNSPADDAFFRLERDGKTGFLASDRMESMGKRDLFVVYFKEELAEAMRSSRPAVFADVGKMSASEAEAAASSAERETVLLSPIYYDTDRDLQSPDNLKIVNEVAALARNFPEINVLVTAHTDVSGPAKFDLYYGIKRAEIIGKSLTDKGVPAGRVVLRSVGPAYPMARNVLGLDDNPTGRKLNRRVEFQLIVPGGNRPPVDLQTKRPTIPDIMAADGWQRLDDLTDGLSYKVEVATTRQIFTNDALSMFSDIAIESAPGSGQYRYTAGFFKKHRDALAFRAELVKQDFHEASVVAYLDGVRLSKAEAVGLLKKFPDLAGYIKG
ncbi:MAG: OmpA family protein [Saprospiraceae bacterium]